MSLQLDGITQSCMGKISIPGHTEIVLWFWIHESGKKMKDLMAKRTMKFPKKASNKSTLLLYLGKANMTKN
jgi:hypothetical protein